MHLENLIDELGGFGRYQIIRVAILCSTKMVVVPSMLMMGFAAFEPDWWCEGHEKNVNQSNVSLRNETFKNCNWNGTCDRIFTDSMETIVSEWNLVCESKWISSTITSVQMGGFLFGGVVSGNSADSYGRKKVFYTGLILLFLTNVITSFSVSWIMFTVMRLLIGIALSLLFSTMYLFQIESVGKGWRVFVASIPAWQIGMIMQSLISQWLHHWKWLHLAFAAILAPLIPTVFFVDESLRWLVVKGHLKEARCVINKMATLNRKPVPDTSILELIAKEEKSEGDKAKTYTYLHLFKTSDLGKKTVLTCFVWFSFTIAYYGIYFGVKNLSGNLYHNMLLMALTELPSTPLALLFTAVCGRRPATASTLILTCGACFGLAICTQYAPMEERDTYINALANIAKLLLNVGWVIMMALGVEQFPTVIRNHAYGAQCTAARLGGVLAAQVLLLGGNDELMAPYLAIGILTFLASLACLPLEETRDKPLQDTIEPLTAERSKQEKLIESIDREQAVMNPGVWENGTA